MKKDGTRKTGYAPLKKVEYQKGIPLLAKLSDIGVDAKQSSKWQKLAAVSRSWVTNINLRAQRKAGQMLAKMAKDKVRSKGRRKKIEESENAILFSPTLEDIGVDQYQSSKWQKLKR